MFAFTDSGCIEVPGHIHGDIKIEDTDSLQHCAAKCYEKSKNRPEIDGAVWGNGRKCWCVVEMDGTVSYNFWKSCYINPMKP